MWAGGFEAERGTATANKYNKIALFSPRGRLGPAETPALVSKPGTLPSRSTTTPGASATTQPRPPPTPPDPGGRWVRLAPTLQQL
eukprot:14074503-Alexandrium_andersonii.AAC.1